ncbi:hypothetical protein DYB32_010673 [Aphanomyces invadans]|uniref:GH18 domain-containing protein n=1 Tax=Aphanomyces invadans TaxID=157072 RepID=A0A418AFC5_9STRA|nr:hypothetical protein DYB32_010673 [Aphanomyces invadans]
MPRNTFSLCLYAGITVVWYAAFITFMIAALGFVIAALWRLIDPAASRAPYGVLFNVSAAQATPLSVQLELDFITTKFATARVLRPDLNAVNLLAIGRAVDLNMVCGVAWSDAIGDMQRQLDLLAQAISSHPSTCSAVLIGNDDMAGMSSETVRQAIVTTRESVTKAVMTWKDRHPKDSTTIQVPVGIAQTDAQWVTATGILMATYCDVVGVNMYLDSDDMIDTLNVKWNAMKALFGDRVRLTGARLGSSKAAAMGAFETWAQSRKADKPAIYAEYSSPYTKR